MKRVLIAGLSLLGIFGLGANCFALTAQDNLLVDATVEGDCLITGNTMSFGTYVAGQVTDVDVSADITVTCTVDTPYFIELSLGTYPMTCPTRQMYDGISGYLQYGLFKDPGRTQPWCTSTDFAELNGLIGAGTPQIYPVNGRIFGGQSTPPGSYSDTVVAIVNW